MTAARTGVRALEYAHCGSRDGNLEINGTTLAANIFNPAPLASRKAALSVKLLADGAKEALDNRSPVEVVPCTNWELRSLTGVAEGLSRVSLIERRASGIRKQGWMGVAGHLAL